MNLVKHTRSMSGIPRTLLTLPRLSHYSPASLSARQRMPPHWEETRAAVHRWSRAQPANSRSEHSIMCPGFDATSWNTRKRMDECEQAKIKGHHKWGEYGKVVKTVRLYAALDPLVASRWHKCYNGRGVCELVRSATNDDAITCVYYCMMSGSIYGMLYDTPRSLS